MRVSVWMTQALHWEYDPFYAFEEMYTPPFPP